MYAPVGGFNALPYGSPQLGTYTVPGSTVRVSLRRETAPLFLGLMRDWNATVEKLDQAQVWGHAYREVRGATTTSYHAPGIAVDLNSAKHPLAARGTFTAGQVAAARKVLARYTYGGVRLFRWGLDYTGRRDEMHVELIAPRDVALKAVLALQAPAQPMKPIVTSPKFPLPAGEWFGVGPILDSHSGTRPADLPPIKAIQAALNKLGNQLAVDGKFGPKTADVVTRFQAHRGLTADGKVGPVTWARLF